MARANGINTKALRGMVSKLERWETDAASDEDGTQADALGSAATALEGVLHVLKSQERANRKQPTTTA